MLEKPGISDDKIAGSLFSEYSLKVVEITFLPLGADVDTAVYRILTDENRPYFLKIRQAGFKQVSVKLPKFLHDLGVMQIIAPLETQAGGLWGRMGPFKMILYPFIDGRNGYEVSMTDRQWGQFAEALKRIHSFRLPAALRDDIPRESYSSQWRKLVIKFLAHIDQVGFDDPVAQELVLFLSAKLELILDLVERAELLAQRLLISSPPFVICHSDVHAGNILIDAAGDIFIVDWDDPILAPKERDLMFIGGGLLGNWQTPQEEKAIFYRSYGRTQIDPVALAYYRYERIIQDIAAFCRQILLTNEVGADRRQSLRYLKSNFLPDNTIAIAYESDETYQFER